MPFFETPNILLSPELAAQNSRSIVPGEIVARWILRIHDLVQIILDLNQIPAMTASYPDCEEMMRRTQLPAETQWAAGSYTVGKHENKS